MTGNGRAWVTLGLVSALFFIITAASFTSLGLVLPAMVQELHWGWGEAGLGFSLLGVFCGITAYIPALLIRHIGVRWTLVLGSMIMALAYACLAMTQGLALYFIGTSLMGLGYTLVATVPGTWLLARVFEKPNFAFGLYFTIGGLGGVAGPMIYFAVIDLFHAWRDYWMVMGVAIALIGLGAALFVDVLRDVGGETADHDHGRWTVAAAVRTPQFVVIAAAYSAFLFVGITANSVSVAHLTQHGVTAFLAGSMLSVEAFLNSGARFVGGALKGLISAKRLLVFSLALLIVGLVALDQARTLPLMLVYAGGIGIGYGLTFFAATIILIDYFGRGPYLELFSIVNLVSTVGAVAPALAGYVRDSTGSFSPFFYALAAGVALVLLATALMRPPKTA